ncbi:MAG TPA: alpha/beta hydrolase [Myxococcota bacterium]|nr:alpha/beta hydrolase [Myxococcota bacterium]
MPRVEREGASLHYEVHGDGPAVVLAHGAGGNALSWWQQVPMLAREHRVVTFDHRGFGRSLCLPERAHPSHFVADLEALLAAAGIEDVALVCQSMGGWTGLPFALAHPERVRALVLCGTPGGFLTERLARELPSLAERVRTRGVAEMALGPRFRREEPELAFLYQQLSELNPPGTAAATAGRLFEVVVREEAFAKWRTPTLVVAGGDDAFFSPAVMEDLAARIPGARLHPMPGVGHSTYFEAPDAFARVVLDFLRAHPEVVRK